jgi:predicted enzyme related to lactoylglutathione lyase
VVHRQRPQAPFGGRVRAIANHAALASVAVADIHIEAEAEDIMSEHANQRAAAGDGYSVDGGLARPGAVTYLHMPAADVRRAAAFYRDVFGWTINGPDSDRPSFDDASGLLSGAWISDHVPAAEPGLLPYIYVADIEQTVALIVAHGGEILTEPFAEGLLTVATFRDPAGNVIGLWHDTTRSPAASEQTGAPATGQTVAPVPSTCTRSRPGWP